jgi:hypothetical protein
MGRVDSVALSWDLGTYQNFFDYLEMNGTGALAIDTRLRLAGSVRPSAPVERLGPEWNVHTSSAGCFFASL